MIIITKLIHVISNDWEGIYVNNLLWIELHRLTNKDWYSLGRRFSVDFDDIEKYEINDKWLEDKGSLPQYFDKIPKEMLINNK